MYQVGKVLDSASSSYGRRIWNLAQLSLVRQLGVPLPDDQSEPQHPIPRANPFPKVTDLLCRLPLPTFTHRLEAINLGDLLRNSGTKQSINERLVWRFAEQRMLIRQLD